jgi:Beta-lactamase
MASFVVRPRHGGLWAVITGLQFYVAGWSVWPTFDRPIDRALSLTTLGLALLAAAQTLATWRTDLVAGRRRLRLVVLIGASAYTAIVAAANFSGTPSMSFSSIASVASAFGLFGLVGLSAWNLLRSADTQGSSLLPATGDASGSARVMGQTFDQFLQSRLFVPLRMVDSGFSVPEDKLARLVAVPGAQPPSLSDGDVAKRQTFFSGGGGIVSTVPDFLRFCQMLLNGGELDGVRILKPETVRLMTTNSLPPDIHLAGHEAGPAFGTGWGLGFAICTNPDFSWIPGAVGSFNWQGSWGTFFSVDPAQ